MGEAGRDEARLALVLEGDPARAVLALAGPLMATGAAQALTPFVDALFLYNAAGEAAGASVAFAGPVAGVAAAFGSGLGAAGLALVGQAQGAGQVRRAAELGRELVAVCLGAGAAAGLLLLLAGGASLGPLEPGLRGDARAYLALSALGLPLLYLQAAYNALASARGRTDKPLARALLGLASKALFDALFVLLLGLGARGAGLATLASNLLVALFMAGELAGALRGGRPGAPGLGPFRLEGPVLRALLRLGLPSALTQASNSLSFWLMNGRAAAYGRDVLNGFGIANTANSLFFSPAAAVGQALAAMVAITSGAGLAARAREATRRSLLLGLLASACFALVLVPASGPLASLFARSPGALRHATDAMRVFSLSILGFAAFNIVSGAFSGLGLARYPLLIAALRVWGLRIPAVFVLEALWPALRERSVWLSMAISNFGTAALALLLLRGADWGHKALGEAS